MSGWAMWGAALACGLCLGTLLGMVLEETALDWAQIWPNVAVIVLGSGVWAWAAAMDRDGR